MKCADLFYEFTLVTVSKWVTMSHKYGVVIICKQKRLGVFKSIWVKANMLGLHGNFENSNQVFWLKNMKMAD